MSVGAAVAAGTGGMGVAVATVGEADGDEVGVALGWSVGVGRGVLVARAGTSRVLVGVAVTAGFPGEHRIISSPTRPIPTRTNQNHRCLFIANCRILCSFPSSFRPTKLYSRTEQATSGPKALGELSWVSVRSNSVPLLSLGETQSCGPVISPVLLRKDTKRVHSCPYVSIQPPSDAKTYLKSCPLVTPRERSSR